MKMTTLKSKHGYSIPCHDCWEGQEKVLIVCHGFGSSKSSPMVQALNQEMPRHGVGVFSFDFPSHGESSVWQEGLRVPFCLDDLTVVEEHIRATAPQAEIGYFGSSFGAYITLLYLSRGQAAGKRAFLRSAAVSMPRLVDTWVDDRARADLGRLGYFVPEYDYVREMRITRDFLTDLEENDVFACYQEGLARLFMVHGGRDDVAPTEDALRFAQAFGAEIRILPNGEHNLMGEGELEQVLAYAAEIFR
ncbi:MAG: alpha/beta fold hydrolase [Ruminiclostridium sp.]|nr:alpha/beta fold hydrolase [Ruminiclostridium sp.]